jgi:hypothetical protein
MNAMSNDAGGKPGLRSFQTWLRAVGVSDVCGWRWRKRGWIETLNIAGRVYVSDAAIARFNERAARSEFAKEHRVPKHKESI